MDLVELFWKVLFLLFLAVAAWTDYKSNSVHIGILCFGGILGVAARLTAGNLDFADMGVGVLPGAFLLLLAYAGKQAIGYGDGLLFLATGLYLGWHKNLLLLLYALLAAAVFSMILMTARRKKKEDEIPFLPFVLSGYVFMLLV